MSLFSGLKIFPADERLDPQTAVMVPVIAAMLADERTDSAERVQIEWICATSPIFQRNSELENEALIARASGLLEARGTEKACTEAARLLSPALRETAFTFAAKVIHADGIVADLERRILEDLIGWLGIAPARADLLIDAVSVLQRTAHD